MKQIILFILLFSIANCFSQKPDCLKFKKGNFEYTKEEYKRFKVCRDETKQFETDTITGLILEADIVWTSDCSYELTYSKVSFKEAEDALGKTIKVTMLKTDGNNVLCKTSGIGIELEVEMTKLEEQ